MYSYTKKKKNVESEVEGGTRFEAYHNEQVLPFTVRLALVSAGLLHNTLNVGLLRADICGANRSHYKLLRPNALLSNIAFTDCDHLRIVGDAQMFGLAQRQGNLNLVMVREKARKENENENSFWGAAYSITD